MTIAQRRATTVYSQDARKEMFRCYAADQCGEPITTGYKLDDEVYCEDCILGELETVTQEDFAYAYSREFEEEEKERRLLC